ncbi:MAG: hypothetical protein NVS2B16_29620 [Chloroflexota bacterium]
MPSSTPAASERSLTVTWHDRSTPGSLIRRWVLFHGSIALMACVNMLVFVMVRPVIPLLAASLTGIAAAALGNYVVSDRLVFRRTDVTSPPPPTRASAA